MAELSQAIGHGNPWGTDPAFDCGQLQHSQNTQGQVLDRVAQPAPAEGPRNGSGETALHSHIQFVDELSGAVLSGLDRGCGPRGQLYQQGRISAGNRGLSGRTKSPAQAVCLEGQG